VNPVDDYARRIVSGELPAGKYHRLSCERHLRDRQREGSAGFPFRFDLARAERFFRFAERLKHYKGQWAGQYLHLEPWEQFITGSLFGWVHIETGLRRIRTSLDEIPRKNGKTLIAAIVILYVTFFDGEPGAEGYCVATKRDQAKIVFADCKKLVESSGLKGRIAVQVANLHRDETASKLEPLGADHDSTDGLNPSIVVADEIHAMKDRGMLDVMETATGARQQPVMYYITTYGNDPVSPWGDEHDYACKILDGVIEDETYFVFIAHADPSDDWTSLETARKANPNYGVSVNPEKLAASIVKAKGIPSAAAAYKQKHLNLLVNAANPCLSAEGWKNGQTPWTLSELKGETCFVGIDLASNLDLASMTFLFPPTETRTSYRLLQYIWTPLDTLEERALRDRAPYTVWHTRGFLGETDPDPWLRALPGVTIQQNAFREVLRQRREDFDIAMIGFDPWKAPKLIEDLRDEDGFDKERLIQVPQTYQGLSYAESMFQAEVAAANIDARGCPVTTWAASNVVSQEDGKGNIFFTKKRSRGRIDPIKSATTAMAVAVRAPAREKQYQIIVIGGAR